MRTTEPMARAMPTQLVCGVLAADQRLHRFEADVRREQEELHGDEPLRALLGGVREDARRR